MGEPLDNAAKPPMPDSLRALAETARTRVTKRRAIGPVMPSAEADESHGYLISPWANEDWELWVCLLLDAFGTRSINCAQEFMRQLRSIVPEEFVDGERRPDPFAVEQALHIVCALKPRDEAETALAVQAVAVFFATHKVTDHLGSRSYLDLRSASALAALTKTFAAQIKTLREMQAPARAKRQVIKVEKHVHLIYRDEKHVHLPGEGGGNSGGRGHASEQQRARATPAGSPAERPALRGPDPVGNIVPLARLEGEEAVPNARIGRRAEG